MRPWKMVIFCASIWLVILVVFHAYAQTSLEEIGVAAEEIQKADSMSTWKFVQLAIAQSEQFGSFPWATKIASLMLLLIASFKVSRGGWVPILSKLWPQEDGKKPIVVLMASLVLGVLMTGASGQITMARVLTYIGAGAGSILLHEIIDKLKLIPGLGPVYVSTIKLIESLLGKPA